MVMLGSRKSRPVSLQASGWRVCSVFALCVEGQQSHACGTRSFPWPLRTLIRRMCLSLSFWAMSMFSQLLSRTHRPFCAAGFTPKLHLSSSGTWTQSGLGQG